MQSRYFTRRLITFLLVTLLSRLEGTSQKYHYSDKELSFNLHKEEVKLLALPNGKVHLWKWGANHAVLSIYDENLTLLSTVKLRDGSLQGASFFQFDDSYYIWFKDFPEGKVYLVKDGICIEKSAAIEQFPNSSVAISQVVQSGKALFLIRWDVADSTGQNSLVVTAVDSRFNYLNTYHFTINCTPFEQPHLRANTVDDHLFLTMNTRARHDSSILEVRSVNTTSG